MHFSVFKFNYIALTFYSYTIKKKTVICVIKK